MDQRESKKKVDEVGGDEKRDVAKAPISPVPKPKTEASTPKVAGDDSDKENALVKSNCPTPKATSEREVAVLGSAPPEAVASPLKVTAYFNQLSAILVRHRIKHDQYMALRAKVDEVLKECGY